MSIQQNTEKDGFVFFFNPLSLFLVLQSLLPSVYSTGQKASETVINGKAYIWRGKEPRYDTVVTRMSALGLKNVGPFVKFR